MRHVAVALGAIALAVTLTSCATDGAEDGGADTPQYHYTYYQRLPDGREVLCAWAKSGYGAGLSCNWEHLQ